MNTGRTEGIELDILIMMDLEDEARAIAVQAQKEGHDWRWLQSQWDKLIKDERLTWIGREYRSEVLGYIDGLRSAIYQLATDNDGDKLTWRNTGATFHKFGEE